MGVLQKTHQSVHVVAVTQPEVGVVETHQFDVRENLRIVRRCEIEVLRKPDEQRTGKHAFDVESSVCRFGAISARVREVDLC